MIRRHAPAIYGFLSCACYLTAVAAVALAIMSEQRDNLMLVWIFVPVGVGLVFNTMWMQADRVKQRETQRHAAA